MQNIFFLWTAVTVFFFFNGDEVLVLWTYWWEALCR